MNDELDQVDENGNLIDPNDDTNDDTEINLDTDPATDTNKPIDDPKEPEDKFAEFEEKVSSTLEDIKSGLDDWKSEFEKKSQQPPDTEEAWRPKTWEELDQRIEEKAKLIAEKREQEKQQQIEEEKSQETEDNKYIDGVFEKLEKEGKMQKVVNPNDPNDIGKKDRIEILNLAVKLKSGNLEEVAGIVQTMRASGKRYDNVTDSFVDVNDKIPPGANSPVSGGSGGGSEIDHGITAKDIREARDLDDLVDKYGDRFLEE